MYALEERVVVTSGKSYEFFKQLEDQYGFIGGTEDEYITYLNRDDLPQQM